MDKWSCDDTDWLTQWSYTVRDRTISHTAHQQNANGWHKSHKTQWSYYARVHFESIQNDTIKSCKHNMRIVLKKKTTKIDILKNNGMEWNETANAMPV